MADLYEPDFGAAYYRSKDPVKNLKFNVQLDRVTSSNIVPSSEPEEQNGDAHSMANEIQKDSEQVVIVWQEKIFSQREIETYRVDNNFDGLERKYHEEVTAILSRGTTPNNRIFTYVDHDNFSQSDENVFYMTNSPSETPTVLAEKMAHLRRRRVGGGKQTRQRNTGFVPKVNIVDSQPSEDLRNRNHIMEAPSQVMYIMADLSPRERSATPDEEVILGIVALDCNGVLCMRPDFNRGRKPYVVETSSFGKEVFEYTIEHASKVMNRQEQDKEMKMYREVYNRHKDFLQACVGDEFEMPAPDVLRLLVYGEIESAKNFEYDDLYCHFFVDLPKFWTAEKHQQLSWVTQTCSTKVEGRDDVAHFSFPFSFELFYKNDSVNEDEQDEVPHFPLIMLEVLSLDSFKRFRTEGYTYVAVPNAPGSKKITSHCWRPIGMSVASELRRYFVGGSPELEDQTYTAIPSTFQGSHLSKYGFRTETTGEVTVNLNVMMQARAFMEKKSQKRSLGSLLDNLGVNAVQANIASVLEAFKKARQRMMQARENAEKELTKTTGRSVESAA
ncbi:tectonic-like complex member MKS1 [Mytilus californianus]|uniref:tectonic-like complex member MKS1 n=1 Tax=Mytilus californianus TaxID=6549 RepID=UPI0022483613|nr:tectonic-like complex member MKS1 [Mytilus californianus]